jgi:type II secretory pathway pseudopilin PulG
MVVAIAGTALAVGASAYSASQQSKASKEAAKTQAASADEATQLQREMWEQQRADLEPWRRAGQWALPQLQQLIRQGPGAPFRAPAGLDPRQYQFDARRFQFTPPTPESLAKDPGYQFRLQTGQRALEAGAAHRGGLLSGGAARGLTEFGQQLGSQEYQQAYGRALGENQLGYGRALAGNELRYSRDLAANQDQYQRALQQWQLGQGLQQQQYNRLSGLAGVGQQTGQYLGTLGSQYAANAGELALQRGNAIAANQLNQGQMWGNLGQTVAGGLGSLATGYLQMRPPASPAQAGYGYNMNSQPYNPWEY